MTMKWLWIVALLLVSCTVAPDEIVYKAEIVSTTNSIAKEPVKLTQPKMVPAETPEFSVNIPNIYEPDIEGLAVAEIPEVAPVETVNLTGEGLSLARQHKMIPFLEEAVKSSPCYSLTWEGIESQPTTWPLEVRKEMRFEYLGEDLFKGWIGYSLWLSKERLASETVAVMVDNLVVECPEVANFFIDWDYVWTQNPLAAGNI